MDNERMDTYLASISKPLPKVLQDIEKEALADYVPIIRKSAQRYLQWMIALKQPKRILEIGTAVGFSGSLMALAAGADCRITTIENYEKRFAVAEANFKRAGVWDQIEFLKGDAAEILPTLEGTYDLIFMDASKGQYIYFWEEVKRLMASGSVLITDNVLQEGSLLDSHYAVCRRDRTIHKRMREFLASQMQDDAYVCDILPMGDGLSVCLKK
ncbi:MAG: O-methyltransferase [Lachnospiraceae bacterium]|jgi:predicted O-methyltransferase YrrM|nr:O-methyltransferase [Lachnospiraceae bacterium]